MNDDLEQQLQRLQFRSVPASWRREILAAATPERPERLDAPGLLSFLYPGHYASATLAFIWLLIIALHLSTPETPRTAGTVMSITHFKAIQFERELIMAQLDEPVLHIEGNRISAPLHQPKT